MEVCRISGIMCCCEERGFRVNVAGIYSGIRVSLLFQFGTPPVFGKECGADGVRRSPSEETALSQELFCTLVPSAGQPHAVCALHIFRGCHGKRRVPSARRAIRALAWRGDAVTLIICVLTHIVSVMVERVAFCKAGHSTKRKSVYRQERFGLSGRRLPVPMKVEGKCGHPGRVCPPAPPFGGGQTGTGCGYTRDWGGEGQLMIPWKGSPK